MVLVDVAELSDSRLDLYRNLPLANPTRSARHFIVEGRWLVERLLASEFELESILVDAGRLSLLPDGIPDATPVYVVPDGSVEDVIGFNFHRGLLACGRRRALATQWQVDEHREVLTAVVCVDVQDPTNLGGILRNCAAFGVDAVLLTRRCADPFSRRVLRVSMGTAFKLNLVEIDDPVSELSRLERDARVAAWATVLDAAADRLGETSRPSRLAIVFGNEGHGLPDEVITRCRRRVTIPMRLDTDSLNAAVASGIFLYELTKKAPTSK